MNQLLDTESLNHLLDTESQATWTLSTTSAMNKGTTKAIV